jgi:hypothetical protein
MRIPQEKICRIWGDLFKRGHKMSFVGNSELLLFYVFTKLKFEESFELLLTLRIYSATFLISRAKAKPKGD